MTKRILSVLLCLAMVLGMMPTMAFAADSTAAVKAIQLGTSGIKDPEEKTGTNQNNQSGNYYEPNSYIYFGTNSNTPIKWRVLDADKTNANSSGGMFLLSEYLLAPEVKFINNYQINDYQGSVARSWCNTFVANESNFSSAEQGAMLAITKTDDSGTFYLLPWAAGKLDGDKLFFLSAEELAKYVGDYQFAPGLLATDTEDSAADWWLRSFYSDSTVNNSVVGRVWNTGVASNGSAYDSKAARPALNLNTTSVLFISAANGGKPASEMLGTLMGVDAIDNNEWKLTLKDASRGFSVEETDVRGAIGGTITLNYEGAATGSDEYVSAIIVNSSNDVLYYGHIAHDSASGEASVTIPDDLSVGSYTLKVFSEQCNGDCETDYASAFDDVKLNVVVAEAKINRKPYATLQEALTAAGSNSEADIISINKESVTAVNSATLKSGDSLVSYGGNKEYKAKDDAMISVDQNGSATFTGGEIEVVKGAATLGDGGSATGKSGKKITNPAGSGNDDIAVTADDTNSKDTVTVGNGNDKTVTIGEITYTNGSDSDAMVIEVTADGDKLTAGAVKINDGDSVTGKSGKDITNPADTGGDEIVVEANKSETKDTVTVSTMGGKVKIGGDNGTEYETAAESTKFAVDTSGNVTLSDGAVILDNNEQISVGTGNVPVINKGDGTITVTAKNDGTGNATIPQSGKANIKNTEITATEGEASVDIGTDGGLTVKVNSGKVTIGDITYTGDVELKIDGSGNVTGVKGDITIDQSALTDNFRYALVPEQPVAIGNYVYTAPAGSKGDVTIKGRGTDKSPAVVIKHKNGTVDVVLAGTKTTYTAENANTVFAMAADDDNMTKVDLLDNKDLTVGTQTADSALGFTGNKTYTVNGVAYTGSADNTSYRVTYGESCNTVAVAGGFKVTATMDRSASIKVASGRVDKTIADDIPFKATDSGVSVVIDNMDTSSPNAITANGFNLIPVYQKDEQGKDTDTIIEYQVSKKSAGGSSSGSSSSTTTTDSTTSEKTTSTTIKETKTETVKNESGREVTKTTAAVSADTAEELVNQAVSSKSEVIEVTVKSSSGNKVDGEKSTELEIPKSAVESIVKNTNASLVVKTDSGEVTLDNKTLETIASEAAGETVKITVNENVLLKEEQKAAAEVIGDKGMIFDLSAMAGNNQIHDFKGGKAQVNIPVPEKLKGRDIAVIYINDKGICEILDHTMQAAGADSFIKFTTTHFSTFAVVDKADADKLIQQSLDKVKTLIKEVSLKATTSKTSKKNVKVKVAETGKIDSLIKEIKSMGYTVKYRFCRSTKASSSYVGKKTKEAASWTNTAGTKGTKYYYKAKVYVYDENGTKVGQTKLRQCKYSSRTWSK